MLVFKCYGCGLVFYTRGHEAGEECPNACSASMEIRELSDAELAALRDVRPVDEPLH